MGSQDLHTVQIDQFSVGAPFSDCIRVVCSESPEVEIFAGKFLTGHPVESACRNSDRQPTALNACSLLEGASSVGSVSRHALRDFFSNGQRSAEGYQAGGRPLRAAFQTPLASVPKRSVGLEIWTASAALSPEKCRTDFSAIGSFGRNQVFARRSGSFITTIGYS